MRLFCVEWSERRSALIWADDEHGANEASARLSHEKWRFKTAPAEVSEMDPGSVYGDLLTAARDGIDAAAEEWPRR
jgi:hypothetical protein